MSLQHLSRSQLSDFLLGRLDPDIAAEVADYVENNPDVIERMLEDNQLLGSSVHSTTGTLAAFLDEPELGSGIKRTRRLQRRAGLNSEGSTALPSETGLPQPGMVVGEYLLTSVLSRRGRDSVYFATHQATGEPVVIKCLGVGRTDSLEIRRLRRELSRYSRLEHPGIVKFKTTFEERGELFLVMERLAGCDLSQVSQLCGPLSLADASEIVKQVAETLGWLHHQRIVHRDIKPSNLFLTDIGIVKLIDFGLAHACDTEESLTQSGLVLGTIDYMAPEQAFDSHGATAQSDIYSLGCTLFKLLTGQTPYNGRQYRHFLRKALAHAAEPFPAVHSRRADIPLEIDAILAKACAKRPEERFRDASEFAAEIGIYANAAELAPLAARALGSQVKRTRTQEAVSRVEQQNASVCVSRGWWTSTRFLLPACLLALGLASLLFWLVAKTNDKASANSGRVLLPRASLPDFAGAIAEIPANAPRTLADFNTDGEFEQDSNVWTKVGEPLERAKFARTMEKSFAGKAAMSTTPLARGSGAGVAWFYDFSGLVPGETYVLSACFETSKMSAGCLGVDLEGGVSGVRLTAQAAVSGWQFHWSEFTPSESGLRVRLIHDFDLVPGECGYFDSVRVTPKAEFEPTEEGVSVRLCDSFDVREAWKTRLQAESNQKLLFDGKSSLLITSEESSPLLFALSGWESRVWSPPQSVPLPPKTEAIGLAAGAETLTFLANGKLSRWGKTEGLVPVDFGTDEFQVCAVSSDGDFVLRTKGSNDISVFDVSDRTEYRLPISPGKQLASACFSKDNRMLAIATADELLLFGLESPAVQRLASLPIVGVRNIAFSADGTRLVASELSSKIRAWEINPVREYLSFETNFLQNGRLSFSADGRFLLVGNSGGSLWLYDMKSGKAAWSHHCGDGVFVSDGRFATLNREGVLVGWEMPRE